MFLRHAHSARRQMSRTGRRREISVQLIDNLTNAYDFPSGRFDRVSIGRW